jgi:hypothetical protein
MADGRRSLYKRIWSAPVPPKVRIFAWRLSQEGLATQYNRRQQKLTRHATCQICGEGDENGHHAVVNCTKARALRYEMRAAWSLPDEKQFQFRGPDWLLLLLDSVGRATGAHILLLFWRAWHLRNDSVHGKGTDSVMGSANFLTSYSDSLQIESSIQQAGPTEKGKAKVGEVARPGKMNTGGDPVEEPRTRGWEPPPHGWIKVNTDAGFCADTGETSAGVAIRDATGKILLTAWQMMRRCASVEEAEAEACLRGIRLTAEWAGQPAIIETDCSTIISSLRAEPGDRASWDGILKDIRAACGLLPNFKFESVKREANKVAHALAQHAMLTKEFVVKRFGPPACVRNLVGREAPAASHPGPCRQSPELRETPVTLAFLN